MGEKTVFVSPPYYRQLSYDLSCLSLVNSCVFVCECVSLNDNNALLLLLRPRLRPISSV